jgi:hypothetical protein
MHYSSSKRWIFLGKDASYTFTYVICDSVGAVVKRETIKLPISAFLQVEKEEVGY